jgi:hypothetical protein
MSLKEWKSLQNEYADEWTIEKLKLHKLKNSESRLKEPNEIHGVVDFPVWDFVEVSSFMYPVLHGKIGFGNVALDSFYDFFDDKVEVLTDEEKVARNKAIIVNIAWENSKTSLEHWKAISGINLAFF